MVAYIEGTLKMLKNMSCSQFITIFDTSQNVCHVIGIEYSLVMIIIIWNTSYSLVMIVGSLNHTIFWQMKAPLILAKNYSNELKFSSFKYDY